MQNNIIQFKKKKIEKGLILSGLSGVQNEFGSVTQDITKEDMMYYALYWDKIIVTQIPMMHFSNQIFEQFRSNGILQFYQNAPRTVHLSQMQKLATETLIDCLNVKKQDKNIDWIIYNNVSSSFNFIESEDLIEQHSLRIEISKCLPYPSKYVHLDQLLRFKEDYSSELERLNYSQFKLFQLISNLTPLERSNLGQQYEINEFQNSVDEYIKAFSCKYPIYNLKSIFVDIKDNKSSLLEVGTAIGDLAFSGFSPSALLTLGKSTINIFSSKQKIHQTMLGSPQFHYLSSAINSGIILQPIRN